MNCKYCGSLIFIDCDGVCFDCDELHRVNYEKYLRDNKDDCEKSKEIERDD